MEADRTLQRQCAANRLQQMGGYYPQGSVERLALTMGAEALREVERLSAENKGLVDALDRATKESVAKRPCISREQVEQIKGVWVFNDDWWEFLCSECHKGIGNIERYKFCPHCGAPMTDEAVEMVMERLEALNDGKSD